MVLHCASFAIIATLPRITVQDVSRTVFALPNNGSSVLAKHIAKPGQSYPDKTVVDLNEEFFLVKKGESLCYISKQISPLKRLHDRFSLAKEVIDKMIQKNDGSSMVLVSTKSLSASAQRSIVDIADEYFAISTSVEQISSQSYSFTMGGRVAFSSPVGVLRANFELDQDPAQMDIFWNSYKVTRDITGVLSQDKQKPYERSLYPTSKHQTYRIAIGYFPERQIESTLVTKLSEAVDEVVSSEKRRLGAELEKLAQPLFKRQSKYYADITDKSPLSESEVAKWKRRLKEQLMEEGYTARRAEEIVSLSTQASRELVLFMESNIQVDSKQKPTTVAPSAFIWP
jgi:hypothetical protein